MFRTTLPQYSKSNNLIFNSLKIFNQPIRPSRHGYKSNPLTENIIMTEGIELSNNQSFFSIGFINIDYTYIKHMQYAYMLKGIDKDWTNLGTQQEVSFRNLPPGKYVLMVKTAKRRRNTSGQAPFLHQHIPRAANTPHVDNWPTRNTQAKISLARKRGVGHLPKCATVAPTGEPTARFQEKRTQGNEA